MVGMHRVLALVVLLSTALPAGADAQAWRASIMAVAVVDEAGMVLSTVPPESSGTLLIRRQPGLFSPIAGGMIGGTIGMFTGAVIGQGISHGRTDEISNGAAWGLVVGETLLMPIGVHFANHDGGSLLADVAVSTGIGAATILAGRRGNDSGILLVGVVGQLVAVVATERGIAKRRLEEAGGATEPLSGPGREAVKPWIANDDSTRGPSDTASARTFHPPGVGQLRTQAPLAIPIVVGTVLGTFAGYEGALIGDRTSPAYDDIPVGAALGFVAGETIGMPLGVHFGNARRGSFLGDLGMSALGQAAAIGLSLLTSSSAGYFVGLAGQVALTVANERRVGARRDAEIRPFEP